MKRMAIITGVIAILLTTVAFILAHNSLPTLDGEVLVEGLSAQVIIERDALGIPTIRGDNRLDVALATGFVYAQDRFFQMDLLRRDSAGELAALVGSVAIEHDKARRQHRLRNTARLVVEEMGERERKIATAYMEGVNAGLEALRTRPFEYLLLRVRPEYWQMEDTILAIYAMYFQLSDHPKLDW